MLVQYVTVARIPLATAVAILLQFAAPYTALAWAVVGILIVQELTDMFDGHLARTLGASSRFGSLFDPYCDSMARLITFFGLAAAPSSMVTVSLCPYWLFLLMALRDVSVAYIRIMCILSGKQVGARASGKTKAWAQGLGAILLVVILAAGWSGEQAEWARRIIVYAIAAITLWSLLDYFDAARQKQK
jgi:CDP-diacylglycerol--glycerol-3-phosphate 3-phosphatidyltransferase